MPRTVLAQHARSLAPSAWPQVRIYFDLSNQKSCFRVVREHERKAAHEYGLLVHIRLDIMLFRPLSPPTVARLLTIGEHPAAIVWKPWGDDHGGVIDLMGFANRAGADLIHGVIGNASAHVHSQRAFHPQPSDDPRTHSFFPERLTRAQLELYGAELRRFSWPHCRVDDRVRCRYPGEVQRLLRSFPDVAPPSQACGGVLAHAEERRERRLAYGCCSKPRLPVRVLSGLVVGEQRPSRAKVCLDEWKGSSQCAWEWRDAECCEVIAACEAIAEGKAPQGLRAHTPPADGEQPPPLQRGHDRSGRRERRRGRGLGRSGDVRR